MNLAVELWLSSGLFFDDLHASAMRVSSLTKHRYSIDVVVKLPAKVPHDLLQADTVDRTLRLNVC